MKKLLLITLLIVSMVAINSCGRRYAKGKYIEPDTIILRSDKFVEADLQQIAEHFAKEIAASNLGSLSEPPKVLISLVTNTTDEHIDMESLTDKIRVNIFKTAKFQFINAKLRSEVAKEYEYEDSQYVRPDTAKKVGQQIGADYLLSGTISSIKQPVGRQEIVYYKMTLEMTDLSTNIISWLDDIEIKKKFRKRFTGP